MEDRLELLAGRFAHSFTGVVTPDSEMSPDEFLEAAGLIAELEREIARVRNFEITFHSCPQTVLVVAGPADRQSAAEILSRRDCSVLEAADGSAALELCATLSEPLSVLLTSARLSDMSGCDLAERAARLRPELRTILLPEPLNPETLARALDEVSEPQLA